MKIVVTDEGTLLPVVLEREITELELNLIRGLLDMREPNVYSLMTLVDLRIIQGVLNAVNNENVDGGLMADELDLLRRIDAEIKRREVIDR